MSPWRLVLKAQTLVVIATLVSCLLLATARAAEDGKAEHRPPKRQDLHGRPGALDPAVDRLQGQHHRRRRRRQGHDAADRKRDQGHRSRREAGASGAHRYPHPPDHRCPQRRQMQPCRREGDDRRAEAGRPGLPRGRIRAAPTTGSKQRSSTITAFRRPPRTSTPSKPQGRSRSGAMTGIRSGSTAEAWHCLASRLKHRTCREARSPATLRARRPATSPTVPRSLSMRRFRRRRWRKRWR